MTGFLFDQQIMHRICKFRVKYETEIVFLLILFKVCKCIFRLNQIETLINR